MAGSTMCRYLQGRGGPSAICSHAFRPCATELHTWRGRGREREDIGCKWKGSAIGINLRSDGERSSKPFAAVLGVHCNLQLAIQDEDMGFCSN